MDVSVKKEETIDISEQARMIYRALFFLECNGLDGCTPTNPKQASVDPTPHFTCLVEGRCSDYATVYYYD